MRNRAVGRHNMNEYSSRSHTILTVHITSEQKVKNYQFCFPKMSQNYMSVCLYVCRNNCRRWQFLSYETIPQRHQLVLYMAAMTLLSPSCISVL